MPSAAKRAVLMRLTQLSRVSFCHRTSWSDSLLRLLNDSSVELNESCYGADHLTVVSINDGGVACVGATFDSFDT